jgi:opacity protein-like surface antigen
MKKFAIAAVSAALIFSATVANAAIETVPGNLDTGTARSFWSFFFG